MTKAVKAVSPKGLASYPKIFKPNTRFNSEGVYETGLVVKADQAAAFQEQIKQVFIDEFGNGKLAKAFMPWKENEDGDVVFTFKSSKKPMVYDSKGLPIKKELDVGSGSELKIGTAIYPWSAGGKVGAKLYLNSVQIIQLVEYSGSPFSAEEGGYVAEEDDAEDKTEVAEEEAVNF